MNSKIQKISLVVLPRGLRCLKPFQKNPCRPNSGGSLATSSFAFVVVVAKSGGSPTFCSGQTAFQHTLSLLQKSGPYNCILVVTPFGLKCTLLRP